MTRDPFAPSTCRSCQAVVIWTITEAGKRMPCDVAPAEDGKFFLFRRAAKDGKPAHVAAISCWSDHPSAERARKSGQATYHSHFSTCPQAGQHRRPR